MYIRLNEIYRIEEQGKRHCKEATNQKVAQKVALSQAQMTVLFQKDSMCNDREKRERKDRKEGKGNC